MNVEYSSISRDAVFVQPLLPSELYFPYSALVFKETKTLRLTTLNAISIEQKDFRDFRESQSPSSVRNAVFAMLINFHKASAHSALDILNTLFCGELISKLLDGCAVSNRSVISFCCATIAEGNYYITLSRDYNRH